MFIEYVKIGMEKHKSRDYYGSIFYFTKAIEIDSNDLMTFNLYLGIGEAKYKLQDFSGSINAYNRGLAFYNINRQIFSQQHPQIVQSNLSLLGQAFRIRGNAKKELLDYHGAIEDYNKSIDFNSNLSDSIYSRGVAKMELGNFQQAKHDFEKVIELDSNDSSAYRNLGNAKYQLGDYKGALSAYDKAIDLQIPILHRSEVYNNRGLAKVSLGNLKGADEDFLNALQINPNDYTALKNREMLINYLKNSE